MGYYTTFQLDVLDIEPDISATEALESFKYLFLQDCEEYKHFGDDAFCNSSFFEGAPKTEKELLEKVIDYFIESGFMKEKNEFPSALMKEGAGTKVYQALIIDVEDMNSESMKWYDWEKDMQRLSTFSDNIVWVIDGDGEDNGDIWRFYYKGGRRQNAYARIEYDDYAEDLLK